jgi:hypothetical protein
MELDLPERLRPTRSLTVNLPSGGSFDPRVVGADKRIHFWRQQLLNYGGSDKLARRRMGKQEARCGALTASHPPGAASNSHAT